VRDVQALAFAKPIEWLFLVVSLVLTWRYGWILDDAFVYFRYVDNWLFLERGLVFNFGEFVEGYTSPLWVFWLAAARLSRVDYWTLVRVFSLMFALCFWAMCVMLRRRLTKQGPVANLPLAILATHYGVQSYFSSGLETPLVQLMALVYALLALNPKSRWLGLVAGLAPLVRHDLGLPWLVYVVFLTVTARRPPLWLILGGIGTTGAWFVFRITYYADLLPNTYYLKDATDFSQGARYLENTLGSQGLGWVLLGLGALGAWVVWKSRRDGSELPELEGSARGLMLLAALTSMAYVWRAGGDMLFYRFLAFPVVLAVSALHGVAERAWDGLRVPRRELLYPALAALAAFVLALGYPAQLRAHPFTVQAVHGETMRKVDGISDGSWHRYHPELSMSEQRSRENDRLLARYEAFVEGAAPSRHVAEGLCVRAYFAFDRNIVHSWGLTEPILARSDVKSDRPGHKYGLLMLARDLARARRAAGGEAEPGMLRRALARGPRPRWIETNLDAIEAIEHKMYNRHHFGENLARATAATPRILVTP